MDKDLRYQFDAFDLLECRLRGIRPARNGGIRESFFMAGVRAQEAMPTEPHVRTADQLPDVTFIVYIGRDILVSVRGAKAEGYAAMHCMMRKSGTLVLRGKSAVLLGREIMRCIMLGLTVSVEIGEDWQ